MLCPVLAMTATAFAGQGMAVLAAPTASRSPPPKSPNVNAKAPLPARAPISPDSLCEPTQCSHATLPFNGCCNPGYRRRPFAPGRSRGCAPTVAPPVPSAKYSARAAIDWAGRELAEDVAQAAPGRSRSRQVAAASAPCLLQQVLVVRRRGRATQSGRFAAPACDGRRPGIRGPALVTAARRQRVQDPLALAVRRVRERGDRTSDRRCRIGRRCRGGRHGHRPLDVEIEMSGVNTPPGRGGRRVRRRCGARERSRAKGEHRAARALQPRTTYAPSTEPLPQALARKRRARARISPGRSRSGGTDRHALSR